MKCTSLKTKRQRSVNGSGSGEKQTGQSPFFIAADPHFENQADSISNKIVAAKDSSFFAPSLQAGLSTSPIQRKETTSALTAEVSTVNSAINSPGKPLDGTTKQYMESRFEQNFDSVKVHNDDIAHHSADAISARAYTHQNHIVFDNDEYNPYSSSGKKLIAHELTHVLQQKGNSADKIVQRAPTDVDEEKRIDSLIPRPTAADTGFACVPKPVNNADFVRIGKKLNFDPGSAFGITIIDQNSMLLPAVSLDKDKHLEKTTVVVVVPSFYIQQSIPFPDSSGKVGIGQSSCTTDVIHYLMTTAGATKVREGEEEHCSDFNLAYKLSIEKYANAVNKLSKSKTKFKDEADANEKLKKITGVDPTDWLSKFLCLARKTRKRDHSDHKPPLVMQARAYPTERNCKFPTVWINDKTFPSIKGQDSKDIVTGC